MAGGLITDYVDYASGAPTSTRSGGPTVVSGQWSLYQNTANGDVWAWGLNGTPAWVKIYDHAGSFVNPMSAVGDIVLGGTAGAATRLAIGSTGQVPTVAGGTLVYASPSGGSLTSGSNLLGSDVTMTNANQYYGGPAVTVGAGSYLLIGTALVLANTAVATVKLSDGTTVLNHGSFTQAIGAADPGSITLVGIASPGGSATYTISAASTVTGSTLKAASNFNGAGNNASALYYLKFA